MSEADTTDAPSAATKDDYAICTEWLEGIHMPDVKDTPGWTELLAAYATDPCHPEDLCMHELGKLEIDAIAWLHVLAFAFSLQGREQ